MSTYTKPVTVRLPADLEKWVKRKAKDRHVKVAQVIRELARKEMESEKEAAAK